MVSLCCRERWLNRPAVLLWSSRTVCVGVVELNEGVAVVLEKMVELSGCSVVEFSDILVGVVEISHGVTVLLEELSDCSTVVFPNISV